MNAKKIAERLRRLAKYEIPSQPFTSRELKGIITDIADELDPPAKPLLADAKVGDLCKRHDGSFCQITDVIDGFPKLWKTANLEFHTSDGVYYPICTNADNTSPIIATEPLAEVGTAEWALQMMKLGNKVRNRDWDGGSYERSLLYCQLIGETIKYNEGCSAFDVCLSDWEAPYIKNTGWQLYEEPQPTYKVGDWVEYKKGKHHQVDSVHDGCCYLSYGKGCGCFSALYSDITRKLDPSEVRVKVVLEGTVERHDGNPQYWFKLRSSEYNYALISIDMLDTPTRELVESLLRAQEEQ